MAMAAVTVSSAMAQQPVDYVNPIIGTNGMGHTFPGACTPFGWVQLSPDTDTIPHNVNGAYQKNAYEYCAGYQYRDKTIVGFSHTHLSGTGHSDLGDILLMPAVGELKLNPGRADYPDEGYRSRFSHATEKAAPGYYEVMLDDYGIKAQLTATQRVGIHKYTFPKGKDGHLILDLVHGIYNYDGKVLWANLRVENDTLLTGYRITNGWARTNYTYFAISLSQPIREYGYKDKEKVDVRFAFCFPDTYEIGMSNIGMRILYATMNQMPGVWCERVFAPWGDMEAEMRRAGIPLYALESFDPIKDFDIIAFSIGYEMAFPAMVDMLDLAGVPLHASERTALTPLVVAGGTAMYNCEPIADFIDLALIGEGEEMNAELIELHRRARREGWTKPQFLRATAQIGGD